MRFRKTDEAKNYDEFILLRLKRFIPAQRRELSPEIKQQGHSQVTAKLFSRNTD